MTEENQLVFLGQIIPALDPNEDLRDVPEDRFHESHARQFNVDDLPLCMEHDGQRVIGKVLKGYSSKGGQKLILGAIDQSTPEGQKAARNIIGGKRRELSIAHEGWRFRGKRTEIQTQRPLEVSLTKKGDFPNSRIIHIFGQQSVTMDQQQQQPPTETPAQQMAQPQPTQAEPVEQQQQQVDYSNMTIDQMLEQAKQEDLTKEDAIEVAAQLVKALQETQRHAQMLREQNEQLAAAQAQTKENQIKEEMQEYLEIMKNAGIAVDPNFADLAMGKVRDDTRLVHSIRVHSAALANKLVETNKTNEKLNGKVEKLKSVKRESGLRNHFASMANGAMSKSYYTAQPTQRFADTAYARAASAIKQEAPLAQQPLAPQQQQPTGVPSWGELMARQLQNMSQGAPAPASWTQQ